MASGRAHLRGVRSWARTSPHLSRCSLGQLLLTREQAWKSPCSPLPVWDRTGSELQVCVGHDTWGDTARGTSAVDSQPVASVAARAASEVVGTFGVRCLGVNVPVWEHTRVHCQQSSAVGPRAGRVPARTAGPSAGACAPRPIPSSADGGRAPRSLARSPGALPGAGGPAARGADRGNSRRGLEPARGGQGGRQTPPRAATTLSRGGTAVLRS